MAGLTLRADRAQVTAILGPNGAGKTTTVEICEGYRRADAGQVRVLGLDPVRDARALRPRVGRDAAGRRDPDDRQGRGVPAGDGPVLRPADRPGACCIDRLGLAASVRTPFRRLSGGQQQRLSLAAAVIGRPELVFLDEPTAGLDPQARHATWDLITGLRASGASVILTTHQMDEAEQLADHVVIVDHGQVVADGTPAELTGTAGQLRFRAEPDLDTESLLAALPAGSAAKESPAGHYLVQVTGRVDPQLLAAVTAWCADRGRAGAEPADREPHAGGRVPRADRAGAAVMTELTALAGPGARRGAAAPDGGRAGRPRAAHDGSATASSCCCGDHPGAAAGRVQPGAADQLRPGAADRLPGPGHPGAGRHVHGVHQPGHRDRVRAPVRRAQAARRDAAGAARADRGQDAGRAGRRGTAGRS